MANEKASGKKSSAPKVMDVAKPGKSAPSTTSRPVIVGHGPMMQDPMVNDQNDSKKEENTEKVVVHGPKVIAPLGISNGSTEETKKAEPPGAPEPPAEPEATPETLKPEDQPTEAAEPKPDAQPEPQKAEATPEPAKDEPSEDGAVDALAEQAAKAKKPPEDVEAAKRQEALDKLVTEKKYFVPIGQVSRRRHARWALFLFILLVLAAACVLAVDAEVVDLGIDLPFDLIKM